MTARDDARRRHPSAGGHTPPPAGRPALPTIVAAVSLTVLLPVLGRILPYAAAVLAVWLISLVVLVAAWAAVCELIHRRRRQRFNRHTAQAMRVVEE